MSLPADWLSHIKLNYLVRNYHEFIRVSKDIASLENEMLELKGVLEEWRTVPEGLENEQTFDQSSGMSMSESPNYLSSSWLTGFSR